MCILLSLFKINVTTHLNVQYSSSYKILQTFKISFDFILKESCYYSTSFAEAFLVELFSTALISSIQGYDVLIHLAQNTTDWKADDVIGSNVKKSLSFLEEG